MAHDIGPETDKAVSELLRADVGPGARRIAKAFAPILDIMELQFKLWKFKHNAYVQRTLTRYIEKTADVGDQDIIEIVPEIAGKILQQLPLTSQPEI